jgi:hypothetical protein
MRCIERACLVAVIVIASALGGCGLIAPHIDCTQVAQQQRTGQSNQEIASSMGFTVGDVESCSDTTPKREASNSNYDQPLLPTIVNLSGSGVGGGFGGGGFGGVGGVGAR